MIPQHWQFLEGFCPFCPGPKACVVGGGIVAPASDEEIGKLMQTVSYTSQVNAWLWRWSLWDHTNQLSFQTFQLQANKEFGVCWPVWVIPGGVYILQDTLNAVMTAEKVCGSTVCSINTVNFGVDITLDIVFINCGVNWWTIKELI